MNDCTGEGKIVIKRAYFVRKAGYMRGHAPLTVASFTVLIEAG